MIPKKIVYIWFGKGEKSELIQRCILTNHDVLNGWDFVEYTEENYDVSSCKYIVEAYRKKKYAFASDFARFDILYKYGGVYVDTDVEFIKCIPDYFLNGKGFTGIEANNKIAPGLVFACEPGNLIVKEIIESYKNDSFILLNGKMNTKTVVDRVSEIFAKYGFKNDGTEQVIEGFHIYPCECFCAYDFVTGEFEVTDRTFSIHHYTATWLPFHKKMKKACKKMIRDIISIENYKKLVQVKRKFFGIHS